MHHSDYEAHEDMANFDWGAWKAPHLARIERAEEAARLREQADLKKLLITSGLVVVFLFACWFFF